MLYTGKKNNNNADVEKYNFLVFFSFYYPKCTKW